MTYSPKYPSTACDPNDPCPDCDCNPLVSKRLRLMSRALKRKGLERKPSARDIRRERPRFHGKY